MYAYVCMCVFARLLVHVWMHTNVGECPWMWRLEVDAGNYP